MEISNIIFILLAVLRFTCFWIKRVPTRFWLLFIYVSLRTTESASISARLNPHTCEFYESSYNLKLLQRLAVANTLEPFLLLTSLWARSDALPLPRTTERGPETKDLPHHTEHCEWSFTWVPRNDDRFHHSNSWATDSSVNCRVEKVPLGLLPGVFNVVCGRMVGFAADALFFFFNRNCTSGTLVTNLWQAAPVYSRLLHLQPFIMTK